MASDHISIAPETSPEQQGSAKRMKHMSGPAMGRRTSSQEPDANQYWCQLCDKTFERSDHYARHLKSREQEPKL